MRVFFFCEIIPQHFSQCVRSHTDRLSYQRVVSERYDGEVFTSFTHVVCRWFPENETLRYMWEGEIRFSSVYQIRAKYFSLNNSLSDTRRSPVCATFTICIIRNRFQVASSVAQLCSFYFTSLILND